MNSLKQWYPYALSVIVTALILASYHAFAQPNHPYLVGLFPVIATAILTSTGPGLVSLFVTALYTDLVITPAPDHGHFFALLFFIEGLIVLWMVHQRQQARIRLALTLSNREKELAKLQHILDRLVEDSTRNTRTQEQLRESNQIMIKTLERILDKPRNGNPK